METEFQTPSVLEKAILNGHCVAFVGAGFSAAGGLPAWGPLLQSMLAEVADGQVSAEYIRGRIAHGTAHALDEAAQALEDGMGREYFSAALKRHLSVNEVNAPMRRRIELLKGIPFRTILTTNFDAFLPGSVPSRSVYRRALRSEKNHAWSRRYRPTGQGAFTIKLHGDLGGSSDEDSVVITRRDYRQHLYADSAYGTFLRGILATSTVLYLGFSFEDAYLNELRSELLSLVGHSAGDEATSYAIINDVQAQAVAHFKRHEGIEILTYDTGGGVDFTGFDDWLKALYRSTNAVVRFGDCLKKRRILWLDPHPENNTEVFEFLEQAAASSGNPDYVLDTVPDVEAALAKLQSVESEGEYHLLITHWGSNPVGSPDARDPTAIRVLEALRQQDIRVPAVVFASDIDIEARKVEALSLGAADYCFTFGALFSRLESIFAPASETG
jgi:CheY-like chemotaxis protein